MNTIPIKDSIKSAWHIFKKHWKFIILAIIATGLVQVILNLIQRGAAGSGVFISLVASVFVGIIGIIIALGWSRVLLAFIRHDSANWDTFKTKSSVWIRYIKVMIWYILYLLMWAVAVVLPFGILMGIGALVGISVIVWVGAILGGLAFIIVATYFGVRYQFTNFATLDHPEMKSRDIFKKAGEITRGHLWKLIGFAAVLLLVNLAGLICLVVGLIVTIPVSKLAQAKMYDYLKGKKGATVHVHAATPVAHTAHANPVTPSTMQ